VSRIDFDNPTPLQGVVIGVICGLAAFALIFGTAFLLSLDPYP
jgi:hypothetical protein